MPTSSDRRRTTTDTTEAKRNRVEKAFSIPGMLALSNRQIARMLKVDESTIRRTRKSMFHSDLPKAKHSKARSKP